MNIRAELKSLKDTYEHSLHLYERTKKPQHYLLYQSNFRNYLSFIEQHRLRNSDVDKLIFSPSSPSVEEDDDQLKKRTYRKSGNPRKVKGIPQEQRALEWQQKILNVLSSEDRTLSTREIAVTCGLGHSQIWRYLERLKGKGKVIPGYLMSRGGKKQVWRLVSGKNDLTSTC